ncbi:hypothetical protein HK405_005778 [Cladochytrium tenue]|nr:hypothetical protein HK405_005778 [Cladochytrium tenue]
MSFGTLGSLGNHFGRQVCERMVCHLGDATKLGVDRKQPSPCPLGDVMDAATSRVAFVCTITIAAWSSIFLNERIVTLNIDAGNNGWLNLS